MNFDERLARAREIISAERIDPTPVDPLQREGTDEYAERQKLQHYDDPLDVLTSRLHDIGDRHIVAVHDKLHEGKLGAHWLWCVIEQIAAGVPEDEAMREFGYYALAMPDPRAPVDRANEAKNWAAYIAGLIETYLNFDLPKEGREAAIAGIIERRMWSAPPNSPNSGVREGAGVNE